MRKEIGRVVDDILGRDIGHDQEDMQGIYTTGIEEIVGQAKARAATAARRTGGKAAAMRRRPGGIPPMARQSVPGVAVRKPRVEIMTIDDPLQVYAGPVDPRMHRMDPGTLAVLQMLKRDYATRVDAASVARQRSGWPGSRGRFPY